MRLLEKHGITDGLEQVIRIQEYLLSSDLSNISVVNISSALWAGIADFAGMNQIKKPNEGMSNDIEAIATYLPYCDVMLVDSELEQIISHKSVKGRIDKYNPKIFSGKQKSLKLFIEYLDDLINGMTVEHKMLIEKVYGENFTPYTTLYKNNGD